MPLSEERRTARMSRKQKQQSPQKCPKCSNIENQTVAVTVVPDGEFRAGRPGRLGQRQRGRVWGLRVYRKSCDFEPKDSYGPENEEEMEKIARGGEDQYLPVRCQPWGDPIEDETEIKRITDELRGAGQASGYPRGDFSELEKKAAAMYGFDLEGERRREAEFKDEIRRRWEAGNDR